MTVNSDLCNGTKREMAPRRVENLADSDEDLIFVRKNLRAVLKGITVDLQA